MQRILKVSFASACLGAALILAPAALADGPPETPPLQRAAPAAPQPAQPQVAPAPSQAPVRAGPVQTTPPAAQQQAAPPAEAAAIAPQTGQVTLADGAVLINVPPGFQFWPASEAQAYLQRASAPAPRGQVLGLIAPSGSAPTSADFWGSIVSYEPIGHVAADSATGIQSADFETLVRTARANENRAFHGFAVQPAFEPAGNLSWAERTAAQPAATTRDVRHEQRILGRAGVVSLTSLARTDQLGQLVSAAPSMAQAIAFPAGQGYADFNPASDRVSNFDVPGLVTGQPSAAATAEAASAQGFVQTNAEQSGAGGLQGWFPWIALGVVALAGIGWFAMGRRGGGDADDVTDDDDAEVERDRREEAARHAAARDNPETPPAPQAT